MDPYEVGTKILARHDRAEGLILTHPEHGPDFEEIHAALMSACPTRKRRLDGSRSSSRLLRCDEGRRGRAGHQARRLDLDLSRPAAKLRHRRG